MRKLMAICMVALLLGGCSNGKAPVLVGETTAPVQDTEEATPAPRETGEATPETVQNTPTPNVSSTPAPSDAGLSLTLGEKIATLSFVPVSGKYVRNIMQEDIVYTEMFVLDKSSFVRAALDDTEEEIFAYNYKNDQFTYMYFFEGELLSKMVYDLKSGTVLEDADGLAELLTGNAQDLKDYFLALLDTAGIGVTELE